MKKKNTKKNPKKILKGFPLLLASLPTFVMLAGIICLIPLILLAFYPQEFNDTFYCFLIPGASALGLGLIGFLTTLPFEKGRLTKKEGIFLVTIIWIISILICAIPFRLFGEVLSKSGLAYFDNYSKAIFETASGFSTTGLTMAIEQEPLGKLFNFYRAETAFFGGIGFVLVLTSALSDQFGLSIYSAEGHGDKLLPNLVKSSRVIIGIYSLYILLGFGLLCLFLGQPSQAHYGDFVYDAFIHSVSAVSTDGITNYSKSIQEFESILEPWRYTCVKITTCVLMILGSTSFFVHLYLFKRKFKKAFNTIEFKSELVQTIIALTTLYTCTAVYFATNTQILGMDIGKAIENSTYTYISSLGGIGLTTYNMAEFYAAINSTGSNILHSWIFVYIIVMLIGGQTNSASGGIKQYRIGIITKNFYLDLKSKISRRNTIFPRGIVKYNEFVPISDDEIKDTFQYIFVYLTMYIIGVLVHLGFGHNVETSMFEYASALSNTGLTLGITSCESPMAIIWVDIFGMILGRLEFYPFIITFLKLFDRKKINI